MVLSTSECGVLIIRGPSHLPVPALCSLRLLPSALLVDVQEGRGCRGLGTEVVGDNDEGGSGSATSGKAV